MNRPEAFPLIHMNSEPLIFNLVSFRISFAFFYFIHMRKGDHFSFLRKQRTE